jgi:hypothetical protein
LFIIFLSLNLNLAIFAAIGVYLSRPKAFQTLNIPQGMPANF